MNCGICHKDQMAVYGSSDEENTLLGYTTIRTASELRQHKYKEHPEELRAAQTASGDRKRAKEQKESRRHTARAEARKAAGRETLGGGGYMSQGHKHGIDFTTSDRLSKAQTMDGARIRSAISKGHRYPEPEIVGVYRTMLEEIERLKEEAEDMLLRAWEAGTPVTRQDLFEIQQAGERAYYGEG